MNVPDVQKETSDHNGSKYHNSVKSTSNKPATSTNQNYHSDEVDLSNSWETSFMGEELKKIRDDTFNSIVHGSGSNHKSNLTFFNSKQNTNSGSNIAKTKNSGTSGFLSSQAFWNSNMTDEMIMGIKDPLNWTKATFERFGDISKKYLPKFQNLEKTYQTDAKEAFIKMKNIEAKGIKSIENLNSWFDQEGKFISDSNEYSKLRFFSSSAKVLSYSGKGNCWSRNCLWSI